MTAMVAGPTFAFVATDTRQTWVIPETGRVSHIVDTPGEKLVPLSDGNEDNVIGWACAIGGDGITAAEWLRRIRDDHLATPRDIESVVETTNVSGRETFNHVVMSVVARAAGGIWGGLYGIGDISGGGRLDCGTCLVSSAPGEHRVLIHGSAPGDFADIQQLRSAQTEFQLELHAAHDADCWSQLRVVAKWLRVFSSRCLSVSDILQVGIIRPDYAARLIAPASQVERSSDKQIQSLFRPYRTSNWYHRRINKFLYGWSRRTDVLLEATGDSGASPCGIR